ncbi:MAG: hypothetical protein BWY65_02115 [Firmicutes bacterium ADurb.Bin373]|nr:MAG: hypothetical protein BWY65_02115 [Firmicutes bacterium ADurb.Bin373]
MSQPDPGMTAIAQADNRSSALPLDFSSRLQASITLTAIGTMITQRTVIEGVRAERASPMMTNATINMG